MPTQKIDQIESNQNGFVIQMRPNSTRLVATDEVVQSTLLAAFSVGADLDLEVFDGTDLVRRVNPFEANSKAKKDEVSTLKVGDGLPGSPLTKQSFNFSTCFLREWRAEPNLLPRLLFYACPLVLFFLVVAD